jgi:NAD(P)-dependent dehydrogenase (short-subunit alcohol dehydrogenase family)
VSAARWDLAGRTVFITGAARGIGAESARQLSRRGANLALAGLEPERLEALAGELGDGAAWGEVDVRDADALNGAVAAAAERFGGIDAVIANAGIRPPSATVATVEPGDFERVIDINLLGVWRTVRAALPHLVERRGYALGIASLAAALHSPMMAPYAAAKAGVEAFMNSLRLEVEGKGVAVGTGYFGFIDTDMVREAFAQRGADRLTERSPAFMLRPLPVAVAGKAIADGIERRARRVYAPKWILPALMASGTFQHVADAGTRRAGGLEEALAEVESAPEHPADPAS